MSVPFIDLKEQYSGIRREVEEAVLRVMESCRFILGEEVEKFEEEAAAYCGVKEAVGVASGTDALLLALRACGVGPGDEVITTPLTYVATSEAVVRTGARVVFADIERGHYTLDPASVEKKVSDRTRAVIPVHLYGLPCDMDAILDIAKRRGLRVIEDCAQALGAKWRGKRVGSIGDAGCISFYPTKNLGACGDAGMVVTGDEGIAARIRMLRYHGAREKYDHAVHGYNSRLDELQAAVLRIKLRYLDGWNECRRRNAGLYGELLGKLPVVGRLPGDREGGENVYHLYTAEFKERDGVLEWLSSSGIGCGVYYPLPLHLQELYIDLGYRAGDLPVTEECVAKVLSLPMYPELGEQAIRAVAGAIAGFGATG